ncbi:MAG TPA: Eco57I restriction-modification methylase domain-containing protein [Microbacterium sp.]|nr:Eco57I restriction-modification methylase domain-containing protein [Microbacterium sp.]
MAQFMAERLLASDQRKQLDLLDAGAGAGALTDAVVDQRRSTLPRPVITLVEQDPVLAAHLDHLLTDRASEVDPSSQVVESDFITMGLEWRRMGRRFSHVIMNPPYAKIHSTSDTAAMLKAGNIVAPNLYAAFLWLGAELLRPGGKLVAIVPRMLLSGPSFRQTREHLLARCAVSDLHHFKDRKGVFGRDAVQQEVVILGLIRSSEGTRTRYSTSIDGEDFESSQAVSVPTPRFLSAGTDSVILVPRTTNEATCTQPSGAALLPTEARVSIGNVVDFRNAAHLTDSWEKAVPLIGSEVFATSKRQRGMRLTDETRRYVWRPGSYVVVRRISPPEYSPRLAAAVINATGPEFSQGVAFENHVLVIHENGGPLTQGAAVSLQRALMDAGSQQQISERVGGTQINAADIVALKRINDSTRSHNT